MHRKTSVRKENCIFYTLYGNIGYEKLLYLSLKNTTKFFNKKDVYVFTDLEIDNKLGINIVKTKFPTGYAIPMAYRFRLINELSNTYDNILHLDTDSLLVKEPYEIFNNLEIDKLNGATENIDNPDKINSDYHAGPLLTEEEMRRYSHINSMCAGVFAVNKRIANHCENMYHYIFEYEQKGFMGITRDQHAFCKYLLDNQLYSFAVQENIHHAGMSSLKDHLITDKTEVIHYAGGVEPSGTKIEKMEKIVGAMND